MPLHDQINSNETPTPTSTPDTRSSNPSPPDRTALKQDDSDVKHEQSIFLQMEIKTP